jgi:hypothetical protein
MPRTRTPLNLMQQTRSSRPLVRRLRDAFAAQVRLWDSAQRSLEPWRAEGPLRWSGGRLDGAEPPDAGVVAPTP